MTGPGDLNPRPSGYEPALMDRSSSSMMRPGSSGEPLDNMDLLGRTDARLREASSGSRPTDTDWDNTLRLRVKR